MICSIEIKNYRSIRYIKQNINAFQVLIGANASGKTTFLDSINFLSDIVRSGIDEAISKRTSNFQDLTFLGKGENIEFAVEITLPDEIRKKMPDNDYVTIRYEMAIGLTDETKEHAIIEESAFLLKENAHKEKSGPRQMVFFPSLTSTPSTLLISSCF
jgi:predicted ATPase